MIQKTHVILDSDGDGYTDVAENEMGYDSADPCDPSPDNPACVSGSGSSWVDSDGDGIVDNEDSNPTDPCNPIGDNPICYTIDSDGDGLVDYEEIIDGYDRFDPCNPNPVSQVCARTGGGDSIDQKTEVLTIYPNPNNGQFKIQFENKQEGIIELRLFNLIGAKVYEYDTFVPKGSYQKSIDLSNKLNKGIYYLELRIGDELFNKKIVTQ